MPAAARCSKGCSSATDAAEVAAVSIRYSTALSPTYVPVIIDGEEASAAIDRILGGAPDGTIGGPFGGQVLLLVPAPLDDVNPLWRSASSAVLAWGQPAAPGPSLLAEVGHVEAVVNAAVARGHRSGAFGPDDLLLEQLVTSNERVRGALHRRVNAALAGPRPRRSRHRHAPDVPGVRIGARDGAARPRPRQHGAVPPQAREGTDRARSPDPGRSRGARAGIGPVSTYSTCKVPVAGGELAVGAWASPGTPIVIAAHGITANHLSWADVAAALDGDCTIVAPDLRGRGDSGTLPGPYGMAAHADDLVRVLDHLGAQQATFVGHSMGGAVVATTAARHPDRVKNVVLVDGGPALSVPEGLDIDATLEAVIGPAIARLSMEFESVEAYRDFWRAHPSVGGDRFTATLENYVDYDLGGKPPHLRSKVSAEAVRADGADILANPDVPAAVGLLPGPTPWLRAERGLLDQPVGLYPDEAAAQLAAQYPKLIDVFVPDVNHYTITLGAAGAKVVADHIRAALA